MTKIFFILFIISIRSFSQATDSAIVKNERPIQRVLIINSFDAQSIKARKNKEALFAELADSLKQMISAEMDTRIPAERIVVPGLIIFNDNDSVYFDLIKKYSATKAIVIKNLNAYFEQTGVQVTKDGNHKDREASYDINGDVDYVLYSESKKIREFHIGVFEFFTTRNVVSGMLAAGPDIVGKYKHAFRIIQKNAEQFVKEVKVEMK